MSTKRYEVKVQNIFEGPMDLLVYLIKKHELDIYDIPIALITEQFLKYLEWIKAMNVDFAGDFILMASTLTQIKSKMLLPIHDNEDDEDDPRLEITRPLIEYLRMKSAASELYERDILGEDTFSRIPVKEDTFFDRAEQSVQVSLFELIEAFSNILNNISEEHKVDFSKERFSIQDKISELVDILEVKASIALQELFIQNICKDEMIVTFLAVLEMAKLGLIRISQHVQTGIIRLFYL